MFDESGGVFRHWISFVGSEYEETLVSLSSRQEHQEQSVWILTVAWITIALCAAPFSAFLNSIAIVDWPTYVAVAISEIVRRVCLFIYLKL
ncbi:hypothetical protein HanIR_Chr03g0129011 [Helianthus annuus]|nr:hypothetical protein HanIR_Chr03g0129011 [Helianthus annuus]